MPNPHDYTVGWICAIATEYVAAQAFLDEEHAGPESVSTHDNNDYTLGKIGKHNVVIAVLPQGEYGISSAANVARDMLHSFPNVRIGLMVGIGGGAPSRKHDIRLGDVVVSASGSGKGGVFQYDYGKAIQDQEFLETGFLNQPPTILRAAVNGLMAEYKRKGHQIDVSINNVLTKNPRLNREYKRPKSSTDRLYKPEVLHPPNDESTCATACGDDPSNLIVRVERTEDEDNPSIHHGLIASANRLMKDALIRDALAARNDVLCFEMEAAGLMNHFPCLVIRGICDYSDSHKNKDWQGYATMTAAAYAKDLLCRLAPNRIEAEKKISELLSVVQKEVGGLIRKQHDQEDELIIEWLTSVDYAPRQNDFFNRRQPGTGKWVFDATQFDTWLKTSSTTLFCPGIPGAGKTILTSIVVNDLQSRFRGDLSIGITYIYCNFQRHDEQRAEDLLASLLKQLTQGQPSLPKGVKELHDKHKFERTRPSLEEISTTLRSVMALYQRIYVIIDALDECRASNSCRGAFLSQLFDLQAHCGINIFVTSRYLPEITERFDRALSLDIHATEDDVRKYLEGHMGELRSFVQENQQLQEEIKAGISEAIDGMFLLARIYLESLDDKLTINAVRDSLEGMKKQKRASNGNMDQVLAKAYDTAMERISGQKLGLREFAIRVLSWITCAKRPLTISEIQHALATKRGKRELDPGDLPQIADIVSVCAGLVTGDEQSDIIRLAHYTTQQYFNNKQDELFPNVESDITTTCLTYLSFDVFESGFCRTDEEFEERIRLNPFYDYSSHYWGDHAREAPALYQEAIDFLESDTKVESSSQALMAVKRSWAREYSQDVPRQITGLHLVVCFGIKHAAQILATRNIVDLMDSYGRTALWYAAAGGHETIVKLLLDTGKVDVNAKDQSGITPLSCATVWGQEAIVKLLLDTGKVDVDARDTWYNMTPLLRAAEGGHEAIVKLLLDTGKVDVDAKDPNGKTPLWGAAEGGHEAIVELLRKTGIYSSILVGNEARYQF
ncbi:related to ankyrin [Fusarium torulosum]|uniref:Related to ankyrin n=1 Tax=Fusarium torulosum TaxID=33205 RepID=A0AAE8M4E4_9HYPO|nr:related to ankyrin [Fusarium torulosum]